MFGTFAEEREDEPVVYGLVTPIRTYNPIQIQCKYYVTLFKQMINNSICLRDKFQLIFYSPGWNTTTQTNYPIPIINEESAKPWHTKVHPVIKVYLLLQFIIQSVYAVPLMGKVNYFAFVYSIVTYYSFGRLATPGGVNRKILFECARHTIGAAYLTFYEDTLSPTMVSFLCACSMLSLCSLSLMLGWRFLTQRSKPKSL